MDADRVKQRATALAYIEAGASVKRAAAGAGISTRTLYRWMEGTDGEVFRLLVESARNLHAGRTVDLEPTYLRLKRTGKLTTVRVAMFEALDSGASFAEACRVAGVPRHVGRYIASKDLGLRSLVLKDACTPWAAP